MLKRGLPGRLKPREPSWVMVLLVVGGVTLLLRGLLVVMVFSHSGPSETDAAKRCLSHVRLMCRSALLYAQDYDERLPRDEAWMDLTLPYNDNEFLYHCPAVQQSDLFAYGYAFNSRMGEKRLPLIENRAGAGLIYDSAKTDRCASDPVTSLPYWPRHGRGDVMGYADGHAQTIPPPGAR
jgi:hypothetical protein